jgi:hypothetical protein
MQNEALELRAAACKARVLPAGRRTVDRRRDQPSRE